MLKDKRQILAFSLLLFSSTQIFAATCDELLQHCNGILKYYADIIAAQKAQGIPPERQWTMPDIQCTLVTPPGEPPTSRAKYIEDDPIGWCSGEPLRCTYPQIKVGTEENGDDKCACPPNAPLSGQLNSSQCEMDLRDKHHIEGLCGGPPPGMAQGNMVEICVSDNNGRGGCLEGYKKHPEATAPGIGDFCIPDAPSCAAGTFETSQQSSDRTMSVDCSSGRCCGKCSRGFTQNVNGSCDMTCPDGDWWDKAMSFVIGVSYNNYPLECRGVNGSSQPPDCENGQVFGSFYADTGNPYGAAQCYCPSGMLVGGAATAVDTASFPREGGIRGTPDPTASGSTNANYTAYDKVRVPSRKVKEYRCLNVIDPETGKPVIPDNMPPEWKQAAEDGMMPDPQVVGDSGGSGSSSSSSGRNCFPMIVGGRTMITCMDVTENASGKDCRIMNNGEEVCITLPKVGATPCDSSLPANDPKSCGFYNPDPVPPESPSDHATNPSEEVPEDMTYPEKPKYYACRSAGSSIGGVSNDGKLVCTDSDGKTSQQYCADQYDETTGKSKTVCYSGREIEKAANTACQDGKTAYLVGGRWQCSSTPPPIDSMTNPEQGCPAGTVQTSICNDWQCLPPNYRLPTNLDCKAPVSTAGTGTGSTGSNTGSGSNSGTTTTTTTTTSADGKTTTITNTTNIDTKGLQQDSTGKQTNQLLSSISGKQNAIADNTAKSAASDAQTASNTNKIANDTSKMAGSLSGIDSKMSGLDSKLGNIDSKLGGTGRSYSNSTMPGSGDGKLYKTAYPDGLSGVWNKRKAEIMETPIMKALLPSVDFIPKTGKCPTYFIDQLKVGDFVLVEKTDIFKDFCWVFDVLRALVIMGAIFYARKIIMGV